MFYSFYDIQMPFVFTKILVMIHMLKIIPLFLPIMYFNEAQNTKKKKKNAEETREYSNE